jgi:hypothetical protein
MKQGNISNYQSYSDLIEGRPTLTRSSYWQRFPARVSVQANQPQAETEYKLASDLINLRMHVNSLIKTSHVASIKSQGMRKENQQLLAEASSLLGDIERVKSLISKLEADNGSRYVNRQQLFEEIKEEFLIDARKALYHHTELYSKEIARLEKELEEAEKEYEAKEKAKQAELKSVLDQFYAKMPDIEYGLKSTLQKEIREFQYDLDDQQKFLEDEHERLTKDTHKCIHQRVLEEKDMNKLNATEADIRHHRLAEVAQCLQAKRARLVEGAAQEFKGIIDELQSQIAEENKQLHEHKLKLAQLHNSDTDINEQTKQELRASCEEPYNFELRRLEDERNRIIAQENSIQEEIRKLETSIENLKIVELTNDIQTKVLREKALLAEENDQLKKQVTELENHNAELEEYHKLRIKDCYESKVIKAQSLEEKFSTSAKKATPVTTNPATIESAQQELDAYKHKIKQQIDYTNRLINDLMVEKHSKTSNHICIAEKLANLKDTDCLKGAIFKQLEKLAQLNYKFF